MTTTTEADIEKRVERVEQMFREMQSLMAGIEGVGSNSWSRAEAAARGHHEPVITGWDAEGHPMFELDELDERFDSLLRRMQAEGAGWMNVDCAVGTLTSVDDGLHFADELIYILRELVDRERARFRVATAARVTLVTD